MTTYLPDDVTPPRTPPDPAPWPIGTRYPRVVAALTVPRGSENVPRDQWVVDALRVVETAEGVYALEIRKGQDAMGAYKWDTLTVGGETFRAVLDAYGRERSLVLDAEVDDDA